jgi:O-antigen biosynthesis protein WbqV
MFTSSTVGAGPFRRSGKHVILLAIDVVAVATAIAATVLVAVPRYAAAAYWDEWALALGPIALSGALIFYFVGLSRRFWRFVSIVDLALIMSAVLLHTAVSIPLLTVVMKADAPPPGFYVIEYVFAVSLMGLARLVRRFGPQVFAMARRVISGDRSPNDPPALIAGSPDAVELVLRKREFGVLKGFRPIGLLDVGDVNIRRRLRGVPILGGFLSFNHIYNELKCKPNAPTMLVIAATAAEASESDYVSLASRASGVGLNVVRAALSEKSIDARVELKEFDLSDLLGRAPIKFDAEMTARTIRGRTIVVTGAGGSIGSELVRQIAQFEPRKIVLIEQCEFNLYQIDHEIRQNFPKVSVAPVLCDIRDRGHVMSVFADYRPQLVFHAAALKHVPLVELNPCPAVATNLLGTRNVADAARNCRAVAMIQVSTDKAVNPVGVMGATKRLGELYCQALDLLSEREAAATRFFTVRFGNVLGSSGSVIPLFQKQLRERLPLTVTHPDMTRFFMTIHEAVALILHSAHSALNAEARRGRIFVLDMGEPIKVVDIANRMIRLSGLEPGVDAKVSFIGTRPGEKLFEELFDKNERRLPSGIKGVFEAEPSALSMSALEGLFERLTAAVSRRDDKAIRKEIFAVINEECESDDGTPPAAYSPTTNARAPSSQEAVVGAK